MHVAHEERQHAVEAEHINAELVLAARHVERGFVLVFGADEILVVSAGQVEHCESCRPADQNEGAVLLNAEQWPHIF